MQSDEAKILLGFPPNSLPSPSQVKAAYRRKAWENHPDRFPPQEKAQAESNFKLISEAYSFFNSGGSRRIVPTASYSRVVRSGVPRTQGGRRNLGIASVPFVLIIMGALTLGGSTASKLGGFLIFWSQVKCVVLILSICLYIRAYRRQKEAHPSFNPFLP